MTRPRLTSGIDTLPEWLDAGAIDRLQEGFLRVLAQFEIGGDDVLDHVGDVGVAHRRADQRAERGGLVSPAADRDLIELFIVLLDAENADVADVMMAAGVDASGNVDVQRAEIAGEVAIAEPPADLLRHRNGAGVRQAAIVEAGAADDVGNETNIGRG